MKASRPEPLVDPLDSDDEDGHPVVEEDDPETKRRQKKKSGDKPIQKKGDQHGEISP